ncbi:MAG TPA: hypothetical protein VHT05_07745 [Candidatus Elarobacter sp.]|nr:hypothetical protein [Candidatus Elarobacter sp.]
MSKIGRISTSGTVTEYATPTANSGPMSVALGSDNNIWFTENTAGKIGKITPAGVITEYTSPNFFRPWLITAGPDGALWFTDQSSGDVGRITTAGVASTEITLPGQGISQTREPYGITTGPDGNLWVADFLGAIDKVTTGGTVTQYLVGSREASDITTGPDGALWFSLSFNYSIGHITTAGVATYFPTPQVGSRSYSQGIATGGDGAVWFALRASAVGRITTAGTVTECPTPTQIVGGTSLPFGITAGPDAAMWFTENSAGKIGRIALSSVTSSRRQPMQRR